MSDVRGIRGNEAGTLKEYNKALKNLERIVGEFRTSKQLRSVENLTDQKENLDRQYLETIEHGPIEKYSNDIKAKHTKSFTSRETRNFLADKMSSSVSFYEKRLKFNAERKAEIVAKYEKLNIPIPIEAIDLEPYEKNQQKEKLIKSHIGRNKEEIKNLELDIKIGQHVKIAYEKNAAESIKYSKTQIEKCEDKINSILEEYNEFNLSEDIEKLDLNKIPESKKGERIKALKEKYDKNIRKMEVMQNNIKGHEHELAKLDKRQKDNSSLLNRKNKALKIQEEKLANCKKAGDEIIVSLNLPPVSLNSLKSLIDIKASLEENQEDQKEIQSKLRQAEEKFSTLKNEIGYSIMATKLLGTKIQKI